MAAASSSGSSRVTITTRVPSGTPRSSSSARQYGAHPAQVDDRNTRTVSWSTSVVRRPRTSPVGLVPLMSTRPASLGGRERAELGRDRLGRRHPRRRGDRDSVGGCAGRVDPGAEGVQLLEDLGVAAQQPDEQHQLGGDDDGQDDDEGGHEAPPAVRRAAARSGQRRDDQLDGGDGDDPGDAASGRRPAGRRARAATAEGTPTSAAPTAATAATASTGTWCHPVGVSLAPKQPQLAPRDRCRERDAGEGEVGDSQERRPPGARPVRSTAAASMSSPAPSSRTSVVGARGAARAPSRATAGARSLAIPAGTSSPRRAATSTPSVSATAPTLPPSSTHVPLPTRRLRGPRAVDANLGAVARSPTRVPVRGASAHLVPGRPCGDTPGAHDLGLGGARRERDGGRGGARTRDRRIMSPLL